MPEPIRFAHLSDWHTTPLAGGGLALLSPKRLSGWASWTLRRRHHHRPEVLAAAIRDVHAQRLPRVLVTGDLTNVSLPQEFRVAREQLAELGPPEEVFLIPGNHDCYVPVPAERSWDLWAPYLRGTPGEALDPVLADCLVEPPGPRRAPRHADYPTLRLDGRLAVIGLCSAVPTPVFRAGGQLGGGQLERLERLLVELGLRGLCRVVLIHHPVLEHMEPARRRLQDGEALRRVLERCGAELVLHGHKHRRRVGYLSGPDAPIPVVGVPSSSEVGSRPEKRAGYHVYTIEERTTERVDEGEVGGGRADDGRQGGGRYRVTAEIRAYDAERGGFVGLDEPLFTPPTA